LGLVLATGLSASAWGGSASALTLTYRDASENARLTPNNIDDPHIVSIVNPTPPFETATFTGLFDRTDFPTETQGEVAFKEPDNTISDVFEVVIKFAGANQSRVELDFLSDDIEGPLQTRPGANIIPEPAGFIFLAGPDAGPSKFFDENGKAIAFPETLGVRVRSDVPEPSTWLTLVTGLFGWFALAAARRKGTTPAD
jgi:hypothetical protein